MSSYYRDAIHPETGKTEKAMWIDDYFGHYYYGVKFSDGKVFRSEYCHLPKETKKKVAAMKANKKSAKKAIGNKK